LKVFGKKERKREWHATAYNGRFGKMAAVAPQTILWEFARYYPAGSLVEPPPRQAAGALYASAGQHAHFEYLTPNFVFGECSLKKPVICLWKEKCER